MITNDQVDWGILLGFDDVGVVAPRTSQADQIEKFRLSVERLAFGTLLSYLHGKLEDIDIY